MSNKYDKFDEIFKGVKVLVGLRQQGHMPTVEAMIAEGKTWDEIGAAIGWHGPAVKEWYDIESKQ